MSFQKQSTSAKKHRSMALDKRRVVSLIGLAANLHDPLYRRTIGQLSVIVEELESINANVHSHIEASELCVVTLNEAFET